MGESDLLITELEIISESLEVRPLFLLIEKGLSKDLSELGFQFNQLFLMEQRLELKKNDIEDSIENQAVLSEIEKYIIKWNKKPRLYISEDEKEILDEFSKLEDPLSRWRLIGRVKEFVFKNVREIEKTKENNLIEIDFSKRRD